MCSYYHKTSLKRLAAWLCSYQLEDFSTPPSPITGLGESPGKRTWKRNQWWEGLGRRLKGVGVSFLIGAYPYIFNVNSGEMHVCFIQCYTRIIVFNFGQFVVKCVSTRANFDGSGTAAGSQQAAVGRCCIRRVRPPPPFHRRADR